MPAPAFVTREAVFTIPTIKSSPSATPRHSGAEYGHTTLVSPLVCEIRDMCLYIFVHITRRSTVLVPGLFSARHNRIIICILLIDSSAQKTVLYNFHICLNRAIHSTNHFLGDISGSTRDSFSVEPFILSRYDKIRAHASVFRRHRSKSTELR